MPLAVGRFDLDAILAGADGRGVALAGIAFDDHGRRGDRHLAFDHDRGDRDLASLDDGRIRGAVGGVVGRGAGRDGEGDGAGSSKLSSVSYPQRPFYRTNRHLCDSGS